MGPYAYRYPYVSYGCFLCALISMVILYVFGDITVIFWFSLISFFTFVGAAIISLMLQPENKVYENTKK